MKLEQRVETLKLRAPAPRLQGRTVPGRGGRLSGRSACVLLVGAALAAAACAGGEKVAGPPAVVSVQVSPARDTLTALGATRQLTAVAKDASGNAMAGKTFTWQSSAPSVATVSAAGLVTAVANGSGTITATTDGVTGSATLTVAQEVATVTVTPATASLTAIGATQQFGAVAKDANGNTVANILFVWLSSNHNVATVDANGFATSTGPGTATITAAGRGIPGTATLSVAQAATQLAFSGQPTNALAGQAISPAVQVEIRDANGNVVAGARDAITVAIGTNPAGGSLSGTRTVNAVNGIATFSGLWINKASTGYTLVASSGSLLTATSAAFNVAPATASRLAFTAQPGNAVAGASIAPPVQVAIQDAFGNTIPDQPAGDVTVAIDANPGGGTLSGTITVTPSAGVAVFVDLSIQRAGTGYTLAARAPGLGGATSARFNVVPAAAAKLAFTVQPSRTDATLPITPAVEVAIQDAFANTVPTATATVTVALEMNPGLGTLSGTTTMSTSGGVARFADLRIDRPGDGYTLVASAGTLASATSAPFVVPFTFAQVSAGGGVDTCGVTTGAAAYCWGSNRSGQLGDGTTTSRTSPVAVLGGLTFASVTTGNFHTCGTTTAGAAYCWGDNSLGQLGNGTTSTFQSTTPVAVAGGLTFAAVSVGGDHTCGVTTAGAAYCWGYNLYGQLGDGTTLTSAVPVRVVQ